MTNEDFDFGIEVSDEPSKPDRELHDNVMHDIIAHSRGKQVLNEEQTWLTLLVYITGLFPDSADFGAAVIRGGSGGGKTHMKEKVVESLFHMRMDWLYKTTSTSAKAIIDDDEWGQSRIAALDEMNKIPTEMMELLKSTYGDDGGFNYKRNVADSSREGGFKAVKLGAEPKPVIFMLADENEMGVEKELETRFMDIKVDENEEKNAGVHDMKWGHSKITLPTSDAEYGNYDRELERALQWHIKEIPVDTPVIIPTGENRFEGDDWNAAAVSKPLFQFKSSASARASRMVASLFKASALINYHARDTVMIDGEEHIVPEPQDLANILVCRRTLLNLTHGLDEKKFAILDAIIEKGGQADREGTKLQATKEDIVDYLQNSADVAKINKTEFKRLTEEMDENYLINITTDPEDRRRNLYVYGGGDTIGEPNIADEYEHFKDCDDPIRNQSLEKTIAEQQAALGKKDPKDLLGQSGDQQRLAASTDESLTDFQQEVLGMLRSTMDGLTVAATDAESLDYEGMLGVTPLEETDDGTYRQVRPATSDDIEGTIFDPHTDRWDDMNRGEVKSEITDTIGVLNQRGYWRMSQNPDGSITVEVKA